MEFIIPNYHLIKNNDIVFIYLQRAGKVCTFLHSRRPQRKVLLSSRRVIRMQQKYTQKLIDIRGRANISRNIPFNHLFIVLEPFENSAAALRGLWQPSHYLWIGRRQCYLVPKCQCQCQFQCPPFAGERIFCRKFTDQQLVIQELTATSLTRQWTCTGMVLLFHLFCKNVFLGSSTTRKSCSLPRLTIQIGLRQISGGSTTICTSP